MLDKNKKGSISAIFKYADEIPPTSKKFLPHNYPLCPIERRGLASLCRNILAIVGSCV